MKEFKFLLNKAPTKFKLILEFLAISSHNLNKWAHLVGTVTQI